MFRCFAARLVGASGRVTDIDGDVIVTEKAREPEKCARRKSVCTECMQCGPRSIARCATRSISLFHARWYRLKLLRETRGRKESQILRILFSTIPS
jgi:hypothetical protein